MRKKGHDRHHFTEDMKNTDFRIESQPPCNAPLCCNRTLIPIKRCAKTTFFRHSFPKSHHFSTLFRIFAANYGLISLATNQKYHGQIYQFRQ